MPRIMFDAVDPGRIPPGAQLAALYVDGEYAAPPSAFTRFSITTRLVRIAVFASTDAGDFLDVENGDATPEQAPGWVAMRRRAGHPSPGVYMNEATWPLVRAAFAAQQIPEPLYIVARWDGVQSIPADAFGKQFENDETAGYDRSIIGDYWPGVDPVFVPITHEENAMHVDLQPGKTTVLTNPAAVSGTGEARLCLAADFGDSQVRVATYSFHTAAWSSVHLYDIGRADGATVIPLPPDVNKVSVELLVDPTSQNTWPVGLDLLA